MPLTYEEFLTQLDGTWAEWVAGEVVRMTPVSFEHQDVVGFLNAVMRAHVDARGAGRLLAEPFMMKTGPELPGRSPDLLFVAREHLSRLRSSSLDGPADLVVEVISPDSVTRDRVEKFDEYARGGVGEYWLVDPVARVADFFVRGGDGRFHPAPAGADGVFRSTVLPGLWLRVEWLWSRPPVLDVFAAWGLLPSRG